jgi:hypothetical protein
MNNSKDTKQDEPFAIVLQSLTASPHFNPSEYRILVACVGVCHITLANGQPFTHSSASLAKMTNVERRTIQRAIKRLCDLRIFRKYGYLFNKKKKYAVYRFDYDRLKAVLSTSVKMTLLGTNETTASIEVDCQLATQLATEQTTKCDTRSNIVEGTLVAVQSGNRTATTEMSERVSGNINTPTISDHSVSVANKTGTATEVIIEPKTISGRLVFEPMSSLATPLAVPSEIGLAPCAKRQDFVVKELNRKKRMHFVKEGPMGTELQGYQVCAYDPEEQFILITCDDLEYLTKPHIQTLCKHFAKSDYDVCAWVAKLEAVFPLAITKEGV